MWMSPFHLAIVARQAEVVQLILKHLQIRCFSANNNNNPEKNLKKKLLKLLSETTKVKFTNGTKDDYDRNDCTLDGINSVHLAARFHAKSLLVIMRFLKDFDLLSCIKDILESKDEHMGQTPLHLSTRCPSHLTTKILLACGSNIDARYNTFFRNKRFMFDEMT